MNVYFNKMQQKPLAHRWHCYIKKSSLPGTRCCIRASRMSPPSCAACGAATHGSGGMGSHTSHELSKSSPPSSHKLCRAQQVSNMDFNRCKSQLLRSLLQPPKRLVHSRSCLANFLAERVLLCRQLSSVMKKCQEPVLRGARQGSEDVVASRHCTDGPGVCWEETPLAGQLPNVWKPQHFSIVPAAGQSGKYIPELSPSINNRLEDQPLRLQQSM